MNFRTVLFIAAAVLFMWNYWQTARPIRFRFPLYGQSSWYSRTDPGIQKLTANNEIFDDRAMTCAIWDVDFGTWLKVTNRENGRSVIVRVNDRGPHPRFVRQGRVIDLTKTAFKQIASTQQGLIPVKVEKVSKKGRVESEGSASKKVRN